MPGQCGKPLPSAVVSAVISVAATQRTANGDRGLFEGIRDESNSRFAHSLYYLPDMAPPPIALTTTVMPAYGVVFRSRFGAPELA